MDLITEASCETVEKKIGDILRLLQRFDRASLSLDTITLLTDEKNQRSFSKRKTL